MYHLWEEQWQLKKLSNLSLMEQNLMTAEKRAWWLSREEKHIADVEEARNAAQR